MVPTRPFLGQTHVLLVLFIGIGFALAALQNVTVDDAVLTGPVVARYLPSPLRWNQGNDCSKYLARPDPSMAYNGTWHDITYHPSASVAQAIDFTFTGSALYIFFILANTIPNADTPTDVTFYLDGVAVGTFVHPPLSSTDYQYNVSVYANESFAFGEHTVMIVPVDTGKAVLMLFDYLVYTTNQDDSMPSATVSPFSSTTSSPTSPETQNATLVNTAAIVGGTVGGVGALGLAAAGVLCYRHRKRKRRLLVPTGGKAVLSSVDSLPEQATTGTFPISQYVSARQADMSPTVLRSASPPISIEPPSVASVSGDIAGLAEQVEMLRHEIWRLQYLRRQDQHLVDVGPEGP